MELAASHMKHESHRGDPRVLRYLQLKIICLLKYKVLVCYRTSVEMGCLTLGHKVPMKPELLIMT